MNSLSRYAKTFKRYRFGDVTDTADALAQGTTTPSYGNGFLSLYMYGQSSKAPKITQALTLAGYDFTTQNDARLFDFNFVTRNAEKRISPNMGWSLAFHTSVDPLDEFDPLRTATIDFGAVFTDMVKSVEAKFGTSVLKMAQALFATQYNPINNYDMEETEVPDLHENITTSENTKVTTTSSGNQDVYGFNSSTKVPASESGTSVTSEGDAKDNVVTSNRSTNGNRHLTRKGNIGVTTSQQLIESELELRKRKIVDYIFKCFEWYMFQSVYPSCAR